MPRRGGGPQPVLGSTPLNLVNYFCCTCVGEVGRSLCTLARLLIGLGSGDHCRANSRKRELAGPEIYKYVHWGIHSYANSSRYAVSAGCIQELAVDIRTKVGLGGSLTSGQGICTLVSRDEIKAGIVPKGASPFRAMNQLTYSSGWKDVDKHR